jgi:hypothetical protein
VEVVVECFLEGVHDTQQLRGFEVEGFGEVREVLIELG